MNCSGESASHLPGSMSLSRGGRPWPCLGPPQAATDKQKARLKLKQITRMGTANSGRLSNIDCIDAFERRSNATSMQDKISISWRGRTRQAHRVRKRLPWRDVKRTAYAEESERCAWLADGCGRPFMVGPRGE